MPDEKLTVRVGCKLVYAASGATPMLLDVQPHIDLGQVMRGESLWIGAGLPSEPIVTSHGNRLLRLMLPAGETEIRHDALIEVPFAYDLDGAEQAASVPPDRLPPEYLRYVMPSRFCESDKLGTIAWEKFGHHAPGYPRVRAISDWVYQNVEYRRYSGHAELSAWDIHQRGYGVCRDFAHLAIALCRAMNLPARYVTGHLPDIGYFDPGTPMDFHAYAEVYLGGRWFPVDARYNTPRIGRIKISHGRDAVDCAFGTTFGAITLNYFEVWAYQVEAGTVAIGDPIDLAKRLDGTVGIRRKMGA